MHTAIFSFAQKSERYFRDELFSLFGMQRAKRFFLEVILTAAFFAVADFFLNLLPFFKVRPTDDWQGALVYGARNGAIFGAVWFFLRPLVESKKPKEKESLKGDN